MPRPSLTSLCIVGAATLGVLIFGLAIVYIGSRMTGSLEGYGRFLSASAPAFLVWRALIYLLMVAVWLGRLRPRVMQLLIQDDDGGREGIARLKRLEYVAVGFVVLVELYNLNTAWG